MTELMKIYTFPDPVLREIAQTIEEINDEIQDLIDRMAATMYAAPGIGLAANQVGVTKRLIVFDLNTDTDEQKLNVLINPEIISSEGEYTYEEACLSVIDFSAEVKRKGRIHVRGLDRDGNSIDIEAEGLGAICLQHEIDHLNGVLFIDHISSLKRALYKKKLKKIMQNKE